MWANFSPLEPVKKTINHSKSAELDNQALFKTYNP